MKDVENILGSANWKRLIELYLQGSVRWRSWTFWTFLLDGRVEVVEDWGVHDTELALDGVLLTLFLEDVTVDVNTASSSDPWQLWADVAPAVVADDEGVDGDAGGAGDVGSDDCTLLLELSLLLLLLLLLLLRDEWENGLGKLIGW